MGWSFLFFPATVLELRLDESDGRAPATNRNQYLGVFKSQDQLLSVEIVRICY